MLKISRALVNGKFGDTAKRRLMRFGRLSWNGITNHYRAYLNYDSKTDITIAMVSNQMVGANDLLRINIPKIVAGEQVKPASVPKAVPFSLPEKLLKKYQGKYQIGGEPMPVRARGGALFANDWILIPTSKTTFFSPQDYGTIKVVLNDDGSPKLLDWGGYECKRLGDLK